MLVIFGCHLNDYSNQTFYDLVVAFFKSHVGFYTTFALGKSILSYTAESIRLHSVE